MVFWLNINKFGRKKPHKQIDVFTAAVVVVYIATSEFSLSQKFIVSFMRTQLFDENVYKCIFGYANKRVKRLKNHLQD